MVAFLEPMVNFCHHMRKLKPSDNTAIARIRSSAQKNWPPSSTLNSSKSTQPAFIVKPKVIYMP